MHIVVGLSLVIIDTIEGSSTYISIDRFLKLMLGVAVTCSNKQTFIDKIQVTPAPFQWLMMMDDIADSVSKSKLSACSDNLILK